MTEHSYTIGGYYWVKVRYRWEIGRYCGYGDFNLFLSHNTFAIAEFEDIDPREITYLAPPTPEDYGN